MLHKSIYIALVALLALLVSVGSGTSTIVWAHGGDDVLHVCVKGNDDDGGEDKGGKIRVVLPDASCNNRETLVHLLQTTRVHPGVHPRGDIQEFHVVGGIHAPNGGFVAGKYVGIGTSNLMATLHVRDGNILFDGTAGGTPVSGTGTRFMFIPSKGGAIRAGKVLGTKWDDVNIGNASVAFGHNNTASGVESTISGGQSNEALFRWATVGGGKFNTAVSEEATVGGGVFNRASSERATVSGGAGNSAIGFSSTVGGGARNTADGGPPIPGAGRATVGGGEDNTARGAYSTVGGGQDNTASGRNATVAGGELNTASGDHATVPGGVANTAAGDDSFAAGRRAQVALGHDGAFLFADSNDFDFNSAAVNEFAVRSTGGARFVSAIDGAGTPTAGVELAAGGGSWSSISDRNAKTNFSPVDGRDILERLRQIPVETWNYQSQDPSIQHIGPMAQDFYAAFGVGEDNRHISTVDADGVALAAIQGLYQVVQEKDAQIVALQQHNADLEARLAAVEQTLGLMEAGSAPQPLGLPMIWMIGAGLGLLIGGPGMLLGYRRFRYSKDL